MKVIVLREEIDSYADCESIADEIRQKMESDYPEITSYEVEE